MCIRDRFKATSIGNLPVPVNGNGDLQVSLSPRETAQFSKESISFLNLDFDTVNIAQYTTTTTTKNRYCEYSTIHNKNNKQVVLQGLELKKITTIHHYQNKTLLHYI